MQGKPGTTTHQTALVRIAWLTTFVVPLILAALLLGIKSAQAAPAPPILVPLALEDEVEFGDETEFEEEACELAEDELEEGLLDEAEVTKLCEEDEDQTGGSSSVAPEECLLRSARARLVAFGSQNEVRLTVGYTAYEPAPATIEYGATGGKGSLHLGTAKRQLGRSGVIRLNKALGGADMAKVEAAGHISVRLHVAGAPASCRRFETEQLNVKHASKRQAVWSRRG